MGYSLREYERCVPPANRHFHETAELASCYADGLFPLDPNEREAIEGHSDLDRAGKKRIR